MVAFLEGVVLIRSVAGGLAALVLCATAAGAVVGGREDAGALSRAGVMVLSSNGGMCSAVVLAPDAILTAAHCATGADAYRVHYRDESGEPVMIEPAERAVHPGYDRKAIEARRRSIDLALVRLPEPLPARFATATLSPRTAAKDEAVAVGGYGVLREGAAKTTGTFRVARLTVVEPYGPSAVLVWLEGAAAGACLGDSGGPVAREGTVFAVISWAKGAGRSSCGRITQGVLLGPQRAWIDQTLQGWGRSARWE
jgi:hypothetical protein